MCFVMEDFTENSPSKPVSNFLKVHGGCDRTFIQRSTRDIFGKETSLELIKISVQESSHVNHVSPEPPFTRAEFPPAKRDR